MSELLATGWGSWLSRAIGNAASRLGRMETQLDERNPGEPGAIRNVMRRVPVVMAQFETSLDRGQRQSTRRTRHSEERRRQKRPVHMAIEDARRAPDDGLLFDEKTKTIVVPGSRNRFHVFAPTGRLVTSFSGKQGTVEFRIRTRRWRPLTQGESDAFRERVTDAGSTEDRPRPAG
jgi:hypothetical protein